MESRIRIRPLDQTFLETPGEFEAIVEIWSNSKGIWLSSSDSREEIASYLLRNPHMSFAAMAEERIIGAVLGGHDGRRGYLYHLAVHPAYRRQGVGRRLVEASLQAIRGAGIRKCHLFILQDNREGRRFWRSLGWEGGSDIAILSKDLS